MNARGSGNGVGAALLVAALCVAGAACDRNVEKFVPGEEPSPPDLSRIFPPETGGSPGAAAGLPDAMGARTGAAPPAAAAADAPSQSPDAVRGVISLAAGAAVPRGAVLFVIARRPGGGGPPLAVIREPAPAFPYAFSLGPEHVMMPGALFQGPMSVTARLDADGSATTRSPADLEGAAATPVPTGVGDVQIVLAGAQAGAGPSVGTAAGTGGASAGRAGATIRGTIRLAPEMVGSAPESGVLFLIARSAATTAGPPTAVLRVPRPEFPLDYEIGPDNVMIPALRFEGQLALTARLDGDGDAITRAPGDLQNTAPAVASPGATGVAITLDERL